MIKKNEPFKLMESPEGGLLSPISYAALIILWGEDVNVRLKCGLDDTLQALESLDHDAANDLIPIFSKFPSKIFLA